MSTLVAQTLSNGNVSTSTANCIQGSAKAWVNFNGTGTVAIRASYNVSSITDNGTGNYTVNFTNALPDANYSVGSCVAVDYSNTGSRVVNLASAAPTTTACRISTHLPGAGNEDCLYVAIQIFD
jgi:hypothetical protein